ncbi:hypothetical protein MMC10_000939 [Thelotrema lepadinum]|nr:hypothetical protein [Thelotrema lepadinum]
MLTSSPSPKFHPPSPRNVFSRSARQVRNLSSPSGGQSQGIGRSSAPTTPREVNLRRSPSQSQSSLVQTQTRQTVDSGTQYSPPVMAASTPEKYGQERAAQEIPPTPPEPRLSGKIRSPDHIMSSAPQPSKASLPPKAPQSFTAPSSSTASTSSSSSIAPPSSFYSTTGMTTSSTLAASSTSHSSNRAIASASTSSSTAVNSTHQASSSSSTSHPSPTKRPRPSSPPTKTMPLHYQTCNPSDLVALISNMLLELIAHNDSMPLAHNGLTRFHSRAPPGISVSDYLQRLTTHATLSPPILLSMVYYIDRLCALWPRFTITSLTVHRYLIAAATVASKGLSDAFWTNSTYARVGGVSLRELALLELEFLQRIDWRIVPAPEVLVDYYVSLVERGGGEIERDDGSGSGSGSGNEGPRRGPRSSKGKSRGTGSESGGRGVKRGSGSSGSSGGGEDRMDTESELSSGEIMAQEEARRAAALMAEMRGEQSSSKSRPYDMT